MLDFIIRQLFLQGLNSYWYLFKSYMIHGASQEIMNQSDKMQTFRRALILALYMMFWLHIPYVLLAKNGYLLHYLWNGSIRNFTSQNLVIPENEMTQFNTNRDPAPTIYAPADIPENARKILCLAYEVRLGDGCIHLWVMYYSSI